MNKDNQCPKCGYRHGELIRTSDTRITKICYKCGLIFNIISLVSTPVSVYSIFSGESATQPKF